MNSKSGPFLKYSLSYEAALNPSQLEAVFFMHGPLLVIAGAGSGKTRTLTYRVARLVEDGVTPSNILLLTFTRKAAHEMLRRASSLLDDRCAHVSGGTFHSFANSVLRRYAHHLGFDRGFSIMDRADSEGLIGMLRKELGSVSSQRAFPRKQTLATIFSRAVNKDTTVEDIVYDDYPHFVTYLDAVLDLSRQYHRRKSELNLVDYDDLLIYLHRLLAEDIDLRYRIASFYDHIMVDEYQDTNPIQSKIVNLLAAHTNDIMVVGDDSQSIYAFRGADIRNILEFPNHFQGTHIIRLEENYRSTQPILDLANAIIDQARQKYTKVLFSRKSEGQNPSLVRTYDESGQSLFVADKIMQLQRQGVPLNRMAVLFRASFHSFDLEIELARANIQFIKVGGFKFIEAAHIKDLLAHLKVMANPNDRLSWYRLLLLLENIGPQTALQIYEALRHTGGGYKGLAAVPLKGRAAQNLERLKLFFEQSDPDTMTVGALGEATLKYYAPLLKTKYDDHPKRQRDLEHLVTIMERYSNLVDFLADMALEPPNTSIDDTFTADNASEQRLTLSTIHSAKGLEWHTVFVIWALDGRFPSIQTLQNQAEIEEELRLMYVAVTRAQENLFITYPSQAYDRSTTMLLTRPSRFIDAIDQDILRLETIA
jgi:DNA helicase-2/ATP-dependent DNA helicase PcrA